MTLRRSVLAALCVFAAAPASASAATPSRAAFELSTAGKRALSARSLSLPSKPNFAIGAWSVSSSAKIALTGSLRFSAGKRKVGVTNLQVTIGRTSSYVTGRIGKASVRLFALTPTRPSVIDAPGRKASMVGARFALTPAAAKRLRVALKLKRTPSTAALGKLTVGVADLAPPTPPAPVALPAPGPSAPAVTPVPTATATATPSPTPTATPTATPSVTATPGPDLACDDRFAATPVGIVDWFGCDMAGSNDLKSWTNYIQRQFPPFPCAYVPGTVVAGGGAAQVVAGDVFDHRFPVVSSVLQPDGSATVVVDGNVTYTMPVHGIDEAIGTLRIELAADGLAGTVYADGHAKPREMGNDVCTTPANPYTGRAVLTLDLTGITPVSAGGVKRWVHVPAKIAAGHELIGGGTYPAGSSWGSFTIAVPER